MLYVIAFLLLIIALSIPDARELIFSILMLPIMVAEKLFKSFKENPFSTTWMILEFIFIVGGIVMLVWFGS